jgi:hypothetical protein
VSLLVVFAATLTVVTTTITIARTGPSEPVRRAPALIRVTISLVEVVGEDLAE